MWNITNFLHLIYQVALGKKKKKGPSGSTTGYFPAHIAGPEDHGQGGGGAEARPSSGYSERTVIPRGGLTFGSGGGLGEAISWTENQGRNPRRSHGKKPLVKAYPAFRN